MLLKKIEFLVLAAMLLAACAGPAVPPELPSPTAPAETPTMTETPDLDEPVSSEDTPGPPEPPNPLEPLPGEENMVRGQVFVDSSDLLILESYPPQIRLVLQGGLPTPCHQLRAEVGEPDEQNRINVEVYSLVDPDEVCIQVLEEFDATIPLGSFTEGTYTVWVNGEQVGEFTI